MPEGPLCSARRAGAKGPARRDKYQQAINANTYVLESNAFESDQFGRHNREKEQDLLQLIVLFIALLIPVPSHADAIDEALARAGLVENMKPDLRAYWEKCSSGDSDSYVVEQHKGSIRIVRESLTDKPKPEFSTRNIKYVWINQGEFGGKLFVIWPNKHKKVLLRKNISSIIQVGESLYVFTGLRHNFDRGAVYGISDFEKEPEVSKLTLLPGWPLALQDSRGKEADFIIITNESLLSLTISNEYLNIIAHHPVWENLLPNSAVQAGNKVLVGMCPGVAVVEFYKSYYLKSIKMYVPKETE
jgi:hypothetical protein